MSFRLLHQTNQNPEKMSQLLSYVHPVTKENAESKLKANVENNQKFLDGDLTNRIEIYFSIFENEGICAIKYNPQEIKIRKKYEEGLRLVNVPPYFELSEIAINPLLRGKGLVKIAYNGLMDYLSKGIKQDSSLLIGAVGILKNQLDEMYDKKIFSKDQNFIPKEIIPNQIWQDLEKIRPETFSTGLYSKRMGLDLIGSSKTHGGPIYFGNSIFLAKEKLNKFLMEANG